MRETNSNSNGDRQAPTSRFEIDSVVVRDGRVGVVIGLALEQAIVNHQPAGRSWRYLVHPPLVEGQALQMSSAAWAREDELQSIDEHQGAVEAAAQRLSGEAAKPAAG